MTCPYCNSTTIAHAPTGETFCLDCEKTWLSRNERRDRAMTERRAPLPAPPPGVQP